MHFLSTKSEIFSHYIRISCTHAIPFLYCTEYVMHYIRQRSGTSGLRAVFDPITRDEELCSEHNYAPKKHNFPFFGSCFIWELFVFE
jgi:hypothetical protein